MSFFLGCLKLKFEALYKFNKTNDTMKKTLFFGLAALILMAAGLTAFTTTEKADKSEMALYATQGVYSPFKTLTATNSGTNKAVTVPCASLTDASFYYECADSTTLTITKIKNGGNYRLLIKKTVSGVCTITTSASVVGGTSPISLSGSTNTYFWLDFTSNGIVTVMHKR